MCFEHRIQNLEVDRFTDKRSSDDVIILQFFIHFLIEIFKQNFPQTLCLKMGYIFNHCLKMLLVFS